MNSNIRCNQYSCCTDPKTICTHEHEFCRLQIQQLNLPMRLIQTNFIAEESKLIFFFTAPDRVDFRELLKVIRNKFIGIRIELRQIGQRDAASLMGGVGICGQQLCCSSFIKEFYPITAKTAKRVGPTPNPAMYCGVCGRLRCCLRFEECDELDFENRDNEELDQEYD